MQGGKIRSEIVIGSKKFAYSFDEGDGKNKKLLGGKGANLCEMTQIGLPVPPGFVITTEACRLMMITMEWARKTRPDLKVGICGEQGGHPESIRFCHHIKMSYVSCSPPRVPIARLAAAHAKLKEKEYRID